MTVNWDNRFRDGLAYAVGAGFSFLLFAGGSVLSIPFAILGYYCAIKAIGRWFPEFFGDLDYTVYKIKKMEAMERDQGSSHELGPVDPAAKESPPAQTSSKRQPTSEEFWRAQRAAQDSQSPGTAQTTSGVRIVPGSYPMKRPPKATVPQDVVERMRARATEPLPKLSEAEAKAYREKMAKLRK